MRQRTPLRKRSKTKQSTLKNKADSLAREHCVAHGKCVACGYEVNGKVFNCSGRLEWAHLKSRRYVTIRHSPNNCVCLCNIHHRVFTENPDAWTQFIEEKFPGRWDLLSDMLREGGKPDYQYWIDFYTRELKESA